MKKLPKGLNDYKEIITENFVYVDKTKYIYQLLNSEKLAFLSRPRRFGKSLLLSTLYYLFKGNKELFVDTWIYDKWDWQEYPVIRIDLTDVITRNVEVFKKDLMQIVKKQATYLQVSLDENKEPSIAFRELIWKCEEKYEKSVVILIDEYEKPVLDNITRKQEAEEMRNFLRSFYSVLKAQTDKIRFLLITGLTKFTKMGVFSALNNLTDISFKSEYSQMLGYTHEEVIQYFDEYIQKYLQLTGLSKEEFLSLIHI